MQTRSIPALLALLGLFLAPVAGSLAGDMPPADALPLSTILKKLEQGHSGKIAEAEFDDGYWEVKVCKSDACQKLYIQPRSGVEKRRRHTHYEETPPPGAMKLSSIVYGLEAHRLGTITEIEFDDGVWEVELRRSGRKIKLYIDPMTGESRR